MWGFAPQFFTYILLFLATFANMNSFFAVLEQYSFTLGTSVSYCAHAEFPLFPFHPSFSATTLVTLLRARARLRMYKVQYSRWRCALSCFANRLHVRKKCKPQDVSLHRCRTLTWTMGSNLLLCFFVVWSHGGMFVFTTNCTIWSLGSSVLWSGHWALVRKHPKINWLCGLLRWCLWANHLARQISAQKGVTDSGNV